MKTAMRIMQAGYAILQWHNGRWVSMYHEWRKVDARVTRDREIGTLAPTAIVRCIYEVPPAPKVSR